MRIAFHIFRKDLRALRPELAATLVLLAALTWFDATRSDYMPGAAEGYLNLLLPAAWAFLVVRLIHQEGLVGDRQFWLTRPYSRRSLIGAKILFLVALIHLPVLLSDSIILVARGFAPNAHLSALLLKQARVAFIVTLPAAALATMTRTFAQFVLAAILLAGAAGLTGSFGSPRLYPWMHADTVRRAGPFLLMSAAAAALIWIQYGRRSTALARALGATGFATALLFFLLAPPWFTLGLACELAPDANNLPNIALERSGEKIPKIAPPPLVNNVFIGMFTRVVGVPASIDTQVELTRLRILGPDGETPKTSVILRGSQRWALVNRSFYESMAGKRVTMRGTAVATLQRAREAGRMRVDGAQRIPGIGRCSSRYVKAELGREMIKVLCESPSPIPLLAKVDLTAGGRVWHNRLGDGYSPVGYPDFTWLSPVWRRQTFFQVVEEARAVRGVSWAVSRSDLRESTIAVTPHEALGCRVLDYEFRNVDLSELASTPLRLRIQ